jgi:hypothetical protein
MFKYLVITKDRAQFLIEEEGGTTLYRLREFLTLLKNNYPQVVFRKFKGRPVSAGYADLDLVFVVPAKPASALLGQMIEGQSLTLLKYLEPTAKMSIPRQELRIQLTDRARHGAGTELTPGNLFETATRKLVALLRFDVIDPVWRKGTQARITTKQRLAFFIDNGCGLLYRGRRGTLRQREGLLGDDAHPSP